VGKNRAVVADIPRMPGLKNEPQEIKGKVKIWISRFKLNLRLRWIPDRLKSLADLLT